LNVPEQRERFDLIGEVTPKKIRKMSNDEEQRKHYMTKLGIFEEEIKASILERNNSSKDESFILKPH
jgi:hypothetical protein